MDKSTDTPRGIYYGWWNVGIGMLGMTLAPAVIAFYTMGVYIPVLVEELG